MGRKYPTDKQLAEMARMTPPSRPPREVFRDRPAERDVHRGMTVRDRRDLREMQEFVEILNEENG